MGWRSPCKNWPKKSKPMAPPSATFEPARPHSYSNATWLAISTASPRKPCKMRSSTAEPGKSPSVCDHASGTSCLASETMAWDFPPTPKIGRRRLAQHAHAGRHDRRHTRDPAGQRWRHRGQREPATPDPVGPVPPPGGFSTRNPSGIVRTLSSDSDFGLRISFGFRGFGLRISDGLFLVLVLQFSSSR